MKSSYELAMERLAKSAPAAKLTDRQRRALAELESKCKAKIAEREIAVKDEMAAAAVAGDFEKMQKLEQQLVVERKKLHADLEEKKEQVRLGKS